MTGKRNWSACTEVASAQDNAFSHMSADPTRFCFGGHLSDRLPQARRRGGRGGGARGLACGCVLLSCEASQETLARSMSFWSSCVSQVRVRVGGFSIGSSASTLSLQQPPHAHPNSSETASCDLHLVRVTWRSASCLQRGTAAGMLLSEGLAGLASLHVDPHSHTLQHLFSPKHPPCIDAGI